MRKTKIVCTIGPACNNEETLTGMCLAGMNVARLNFSHGTHEDHLNNINMLKAVREIQSCNVHTRKTHSFQGFNVSAGRSYRAYNFCFSHKTFLLPFRLIVFFKYFTTLCPYLQAVSEKKQISGKAQLSNKFRFLILGRTHSDLTLEYS